MLEEKNKPLPSNEGDESQEDISDGGNDESMASEEDDAEKAKSKSATSGQNEKLYAVEGILNTKMRRAENRIEGKKPKINQPQEMMTTMTLVWIMSRGRLEGCQCQVFKLMSDEN